MIGSILTPYYTDDNLLNILDALGILVSQQRPCLDLPLKNPFLFPFIYDDE